MIDYSSDLTVFIISIERKDNYQECLLSLNQQTIKFNLQEIVNIVPMNTAYQQMLKQCQSPYFIQVDEDMILEQDAIEKMYYSIKNSADNVAMICYDLYDVHLEYNIQGIKIYKYEIIKNFNFDEKVGFGQLSRLEEKGYKCILTRNSIGSHSPHWTPLTIYNRYFELMLRHKLYNNCPYLYEHIFELCQKDQSSLNMYALMGATLGLLSEKTEYEPKNFNNYHTEEFKKIKELIECP